MKRQEVATAAPQKWLQMRLRKTKKPGCQGEINEDCLKGGRTHFGNAGLNIVEDFTPTARKRSKSYLTRAGKRNKPKQTAGDKKGIFHISRGGGKRGSFYLTRAGKRDISYLRALVRKTNPTRIQRTDRSYLTRAGKRGTFYLTRPGKRNFDSTPKKNLRASKRSDVDLALG